MTGTESTLLAVSGAAVAFLVVATLAGRVMAMRHPGSDTVANFNSRTLAWWVMVLVLTAAFWTGKPGTILLFLAASAVGMWEYLRLGLEPGQDRVPVAAAFLAVLPVQYALIWIGWYGLFSIFIPVYAFLFLPILAVLAGEVRDFMSRTARLQWGLMLAVFCMSHVPALLVIEIPGFEGRNILLVAFLIVVAEGSDVFQYLCGKLLGRHKVAPSVSPGKTVEGLLGGVATAAALGAGLSFLTPFSPGEAFGMALMIAAMGFLGGLVMSAIKRDRGVKDWGRLIPGHGGVLDRLDSVLFAAPVYFHVIRYYWSA